MDGLTFVSSLVHYLAWPITVIVVAALFRRQIGDLLPRLNELKVGKVTAKLEGAAERLKKAREGLQPPRVELGPVEERPLKPTAARRQLPHIERENRGPAELLATTGAAVGPRESGAALDPSVQFESAWQRLNRKLLQKARAAEGGGVRSANAAVAQLVEAGLLPPQFERAFSEVKAVYKAAKRHPSNPIAAEPAREFARTCEALIEYLEEVEG